MKFKLIYPKWRKLEGQTTFNLPPHGPVVMAASLPEFVDISFTDENGQLVSIEDNTPVSMNMWGFTPDYFQYSEDYFVEFLKENMGNLKAEYFIPLMVNKLINENTARVKVLDTTSKWFGVTYAEDRQGVVDKIQALVDAGEYPAKLF